MVPLRPLCLKCLCTWKQEKSLCDTYEFFTIVYTNTNSKNIGSNTKSELWGVAEKEKDNWGAWFLLKAHEKCNSAVFAVIFNVTNNLC